MDAGGTNMDDYLLTIADRSLDDYRRRYFTAATANGTTLIGHFNNFALHSIAISLSLVDNALLQYSVLHHLIHYFLAASLTTERNRLLE